ncbi:MAG TPA: zinc-binding alcohol dehydrogenase family protein [candidate division Zixibacteria bacterium]|nr:zinc-binding alcohol dehydrogenase family protein [candidate division Zixibacteria bacterium]HEQ98779.1 zinc-binding alcohol dehydrogenase family protein [candidate division Zixibacteria bacterium]
MKAMILESPKPIDQKPLVEKELEKPQPQSGQILIRISVCGACHTDLHTVEGELELPKLPIIPGHEIIGNVEKNGPGAERFKEGDRVGVAWLNWACGECVYCRNNQENLCENARFTGLHADGGYAEYTVVDERFAYPIPDIFSDLEAAPLMCAGVIGYRALRLSEFKPESRLGLYGFGASAHIAIQIARHKNCRVFVFTRSENHRQLARELGAEWTGSAQDMPPEQLDSSVTFAPAGWIVPYALKHLRPGGTLAINAIYMSPIPELEYPLIYKERTLRSVAHVARSDAEEFLPLAAEIPVKTEVEGFELQDANEVLKKMKESRIRGSAALKIR